MKTKNLILSTALFAGSIITFGQTQKAENLEVGTNLRVGTSGAAQYDLPAAHNSTAGQVMTVDGSGAATWQDLPATGLGAGSVTTTEILDATIVSADIAADGVAYTNLESTGASSGQVLTFDGTDWGPSPAAGGGVSTPSIGSSMITQWQVDQGLWTPHLDDCVTGEVFVSIDGSPTGLGFCMEFSRTGSVTAPDVYIWIDAIEGCAAKGMKQCCNVMHSSFCN